MADQTRTIDVPHTFSAAFLSYLGFELLSTRFDRRKVVLTFADPEGDAATQISEFDWAERPISNGKQLLRCYEEVKRAMWVAREQAKRLQGREDVSNRP